MTEKISFPYFPFYPKDFFVDTAAMSPEMVGYYIRLLCQVWIQDGIDADVANVKAHAGNSRMANPKAFKLISMFQVTEDNVLRHKRLDEEKIKSIARMNKAHNAAMARYAPSRTQAPPKKTSRPAIQKQIQIQNNNNTPLPPKGGSFDPLDLSKWPDKFSKDKKFMKAWSEFSDYRRVDRKKPLTPRATAALKTKLDGVTVQVATAALHESIANSWTGVFPDDKKPTPAASVNESWQRENEEINW